MSLILIQSDNTFYSKNQNKLVLSDNFFKHRSISLIPKKQKESLITYEKKMNSNHTINHNSSIIQEVNKFKINNNLYTHKTKKSSNNNKFNNNYLFLFSFYYRNNTFNANTDHVRPINFKEWVLMHIFKFLFTSFA